MKRETLARFARIPFCTGRSKAKPGERTRVVMSGRLCRPCGPAGHPRGVAVPIRGADPGLLRAGCLRGLGFTEGTGGCVSGREGPVNCEL